VDIRFSHQHEFFTLMMVRPNKCLKATDTSCTRSGEIMPYCPHCGALVAEDATVCRNCGASLQLQQLGAPQSSQSPQPAVSKPLQSEAPVSSPPSPAASTQIPSNVSAGELSQRLEKALRRTELLSYAVIGLAVVILIVIIMDIYIL
jgi:uncharacterized membrane protein YvbJ